MKLQFSLIAVLCLSFVISAQRTAPGSVSELSAISDRGRMLYGYDQAAWHSTDAVLALSPPPGSFNKYVGRMVGSVWIVAYGRLNEKRDAFLIAYEATQGSSAREFDVKRHETPKVDKDFYFRAALAIDLAKGEFGVQSRPYNTAILPSSDGQFYVYFLPAQTKQAVFPLGGDVRYLISSDGLKIAERRQLHNAVIEFTAKEGETPSMGYHIAILDDIPEDTDVFHVLARTPSVPEWVVTDKYVYQIAPNGKITYVMTREAFLRIGK